MATASLLATTLLARNTTQKNAGGLSSLRKKDTDADFMVSSNSAFRKPVMPDQSVAAKSNCVDDSNSLSVSNAIGRPVIGNTEERAAVLSLDGATRGKNKVLGFMEQAQLGLRGPGGGLADRSQESEMTPA